MIATAFSRNEPAEAQRHATPGIALDQAAPSLDIVVVFRAIGTMSTPRGPCGPARIALRRTICPSATPGLLPGTTTSRACSAHGALGFGSSHRALDLSERGREAYLYPKPLRRIIVSALNRDTQKVTTMRR
jgi:hypothetical protein